MDSSIKNHKKPKLYVNSVMPSQQEHYRQNFLEELLQEQKKMNSELVHSVNTLSNDLHFHKGEQRESLENITKKVNNQEATTNELFSEIKHYEINHSEVIERLNQLESLSSKIEKMIDDEQLLNEASVEQLAFLEQLTQKIAKKLEASETTQTDLQNHMKNQDELMRNMNEKLEIQEMFHKSIMDRFDKQEVTNSKIVQQLESIRTNLMEKMESVLDSLMFQYKNTIQYIKDIIVTKPNVIHHLQLKNNKEKTIKNSKKSR